MDLFPRRCLAVYRTLALHLAAAFDQDLCCLMRSSSATSPSAMTSGGSSLGFFCFCLFLSFISISPCRCFLRMCFRQNKQPIIRKQMTKARTRDMARMSSVFGLRISDAHPLGKLRRVSGPFEVFETTAVSSRPVETAAALSQFCLHIVNTHNGMKL